MHGETVKFLRSLTLISVTVYRLLWKPYEFGRHAIIADEVLLRLHTLLDSVYHNRTKFNVYDMEYAFI